MTTMIELTRQRPPSTTDTNLPPKRRKVVRFPSESNLEEVVRFDQQVTEVEKASIWYQPKDYKEIRKDIDSTILELMQIEEDMRYWDTERYTLRGLERHFSRSYRSQRRNAQKSTVQMVMKAQKEYGYAEPEAQRKIQRVSRICSKAARVRAQDVGALDQWAAGLGRPPPPQQENTPLFRPTPAVETSVSRRQSLIIAQPA